MVLVDSSVWIHYFSGTVNWQTELLDQILQHVTVFTGDLIITEVLQGFKSDTDYNTARKALQVLPCKEMGGCTIAVKSAENYRKLRKKGVTVCKTINVIIGTFCIEHNIQLLHDDRDFDPMVAHLGLETVSVGGT